MPPHNVAIQLTIPPALLEALETKAKGESLTRSEWLRRAARASLQWVARECGQWAEGVALSPPEPPDLQHILSMDLSDPAIWIATQLGSVVLRTGRDYWSGEYETRIGIFTGDGPCNMRLLARHEGGVPAAKAHHIDIVLLLRELRTCFRTSGPLPLHQEWTERIKAGLASQEDPK